MLYCYKFKEFSSLKGYLFIFYQCEWTSLASLLGSYGSDQSDSEEDEEDVEEKNQETRNHD